MEKYLIKSSYPCLIKTKTDYAEIDANDVLEVENEEYIFVYPADNIVTPFYINLSCPHENENFSVIKKDNKNIIFLESPSSVEITQKENLNFSGKNCEITIAGKNLSFECNSKKIIYRCPHSCKNYKIFKVKNFACVQFDNNLYAYSIDKNKLTHFGGDSLEIKQNTISVQKKFHDSDNREKNAIYNLSEEINVEKEDFMHNSTEQIPQKLIPFKLLESIKARDYACAMDFLSEKLKNELDANQMKEFFGEVTNFLPINTNEFITISNFNKNYVKFVLSDDKIDDILIDNL